MDDPKAVIVLIATSMIVLVAVVLSVLAVMIIYLKSKLQHRRELLQAKLDGQQQTMNYISREIHDNLGEKASLVKINLNTLQLGDLEKARRKIEDTKNLVRELIGELKSVSSNLSSDRIIRSGIVQALRDEVERLNKTGQFEGTLRVDGTIPKLGNDDTIILYRMAQEILNNSLKHSNAKQVGISLKATEKLFTLVLRDDGTGFDPEQKTKSTSAGLINLQSRAKAINAQLTIQSRPGEGTTISIELPL